MNGLKKLSDEEKQEMLRDAEDKDRSRAFNSARILSERGSLDDYIDFLSENIALVEFVPSRRITKNNIL